MSEVICFYKDKYNIYGTVSDGFFFDKGLTLSELVSYIKEEYGNRGLENLPRRLERAHTYGHSGIQGCTLDSFLECNLAGEGQQHISFQECINKFLS